MLCWVDALTTWVTDNNVQPLGRVTFTLAFLVRSNGSWKPQMVVFQDVADMAEREAAADGAGGAGEEGW